MGGLLQQLQRMQEEMAKIQESLKDETVTATVGGGVVTVVMNGHQELVSLTIKPEAVDPDDVEMLQDMLMAAFKSAQEQARDLAAQRLGAVTGGMSVPGLM
ncbi:MAG: YbaB/EbfC family nucleoid-associated protein [Chloroflexi bacterium]|nr:YbaB/EbfC family nucleoid-associated protein [Chloroflexota bacterium]